MFGARSRGLKKRTALWLFLPVLLVSTLHSSFALTELDVAVVVNGDSWASLAVANKYTATRSIPQQHVIVLHDLPDWEEVSVKQFRDLILKPVLSEINRRGLEKRISCIAYSADMPYRIDFDDDRGEKTDSRYSGSRGSLTGLTYLASDVLEERYETYTSLNSNNYYREASLPDAQEIPSEQAEDKLETARQAMEQGEYQKCEAILEALLKRTPDCARFWYEAARCRLAAGEPDETVLTALRNAAENGWWRPRYIKGSFDDLADSSALEAIIERARKNAVKLHVEDAVPFSAWRRSAENDTAGDGPIPSRYLLSTMLSVTSGRGLSIEEAFSNLERSGNADGSWQGQGKVCFMRNDDIRSRVRRWAFPATKRRLEKEGVSVDIIPEKLPEQTDILGLCAGTAHFDFPASENTILPGAICEHLTSFGGNLHPNAGHTPLTTFLRHGAALSSGTVQEPLALQAKFPSPFMHLHYAKGATAVEAFYMAVRAPFQLLAVGDPLCRPFANVALGTYQGLQDGEVYKNELSFRIPPVENDSGRHVLIFLDGQRVARVPPGEKMAIDTTRYADGWYTLACKASDTQRPCDQSLDVFQVCFENRHSVPGVHVAEKRVQYGKPLQISCRSDNAVRVGLRHLGRQVASIDGGNDTVTLDSRRLGLGPIRLQPVVEIERDGENVTVQAKPVTVHVAKPSPRNPSENVDSDEVHSGFSIQNGDVTRVVRGEWKSGYWSQLEVPPGKSFTLEGLISAEHGGMHQLQFAADMQPEVTVDGEKVVCSGSDSGWVAAPVNLESGWHRVRVKVTVPENCKAGEAPMMRFGARGTRPLLPQLKWSSAPDRQTMLLEGITVETKEVQLEPFVADAQLALTDAFPDTIKGEVQMQWQTEKETGWQIQPKEGSVAVANGTLQKEQTFRVSYAREAFENDTFFSPPTLTCYVTTEDGNRMKYSVAFPLKEACTSPEQRTVRLEAPGLTEDAPRIDGTLDDPCWQAEPNIATLHRMELDYPTNNRTKVWTRWNEEALFVAFRCSEPNVGQLHEEPLERDGAIYKYNSVEVLVNGQPRNDKYAQFVVGAGGGLYDAFDRDASWSGDADVAAARQENAWTVELAIPWDDIGYEDPQSDSNLRILFARNRVADGREVTQWPVAPGGNHQPDHFAELILQ